MKKLLLSMVAMSLLMLSCKEEKTEIKTVQNNADTTSVTQTEEAPAAPMDSAAISKAWMEYATPGEVHKLLAEDNGKWDVTMTYWNDPSAPPTSAKMTAESKMILDGRYQQATYRGNFMGEPFEGIATVGYNNASKKMESIWIDNMGTGITHMTADYNGTGNTMEFKGESFDPVTKKVKATREMFTMVDDNTRKMEMFEEGPDGKEFKTMEINMVRKK